MKAGWYERNGPAEDVIQVGVMETPTAGPDEVRIRIYASGVNPSDVKKRAGTRGPFREKRVIPHSDGAGVIDQVGPGIDSHRIGERVWVFNAQWERAFGTAAEYVTLPVSQVVPLPDSVSFAEGACLGIPAMTAHRCLFADGSIAGQTILVTGGAGAVGNYAIQLAKWGGAEVITTISSEQKADQARRAGADYIINYRTQDVIETIKQITENKGVDRMVDVDFGTNLPVTQAVLKENGAIAGYASASVPEPTLPFYALMFKNITMRLVLVYSMPEEAKRQACKDINRAIKGGKLTHTIAARFPLEQLADAHVAVESGTHIGKVVVEVEGEPA
jgi:NADPH2:quinone reductase